MNRFWMFLGHAILGPNAAHLGTDRSCFSWPVQTIKAKNKKKGGAAAGSNTFHVILEASE